MPSVSSNRVVAMRNSRDVTPLYFAVLLVTAAVGVLVLLSERSLARELMQILALVAGAAFFSGLSLFLGFARIPRAAPLIHITFSGRQLQDELGKVIDAQFTEVPNFLAKHEHDRYSDDDLVVALAKVRIDLERMIRDVAREAGLARENGRFDLSRTLDALERSEALPSVAISAIRDILPICNRAIHGEDIDRVSAQEVVGVAREVMVILEGVRIKGYSRG